MTIYDKFIESRLRKVFVEIDFHVDETAHEMAEIMGLDINDGSYFYLLGFGSAKDTAQADYDIIFAAEEIVFSSAVAGRSKSFIEHFTKEFASKGIINRKIYCLTEYLGDMLSSRKTNDNIVKDFLTVCRRNEVYKYGNLKNPVCRLDYEWLLEKQQTNPMY